jgi:hypothetical protein
MSFCEGGKVSLVLSPISCPEDEPMCLESINQFIGLSHALGGLAAFTLILAALAVIAFLNPLRRTPADRQSGGFTCPCYAPPYNLPKQQGE